MTESTLSTRWELSPSSVRLPKENKHKYVGSWYMAVGRYQLSPDSSRMKCCMNAFLHAAVMDASQDIYLGWPNPPCHPERKVHTMLTIVCGVLWYAYAPRWSRSRRLSGLRDGGIVTAMPWVRRDRDKTPGCPNQEGEKRSLCGGREGPFGRWTRLAWPAKQTGTVKTRVDTPTSIRAVPTQVPLSKKDIPLLSCTADAARSFMGVCAGCWLPRKHVSFSAYTMCVRKTSRRGWTKAAYRRQTSSTQTLCEPACGHLDGFPSTHMTPDNSVQGALG